MESFDGFVAGCFIRAWEPVYQSMRKLGVTRLQIDRITREAEAQEAAHRATIAAMGGGAMQRESGRRECPTPNTKLSCTR